MLHLHPVILPNEKAKLIRDWLGQRGAREFVEFLCRKDAELTAEAGNEACRAHENDALSDDVISKAREAVSIRLLIDKISEMRDLSFKFEYREPQQKTTTTTPTQE